MSQSKLRVFISYSRRDLEAASALVAALEERDIETLIDRRDLPYGEEWQGELGDFVRGADTIVWLVSPDSVRSKWVNWELGEVQRNKKRLVPVHIRETDLSQLPEALGKVHLLPVGSVFDPAVHLDVLVTTLNTDRGWLKEATRLADRARQWMIKGQDSALLLRGRALSDAETWSKAKPASVTDLNSEILDLILHSRRALARRQKQIVALALTAAVIGVGLALLAWRERNTALANQSTYLAKVAHDRLVAGDSTASAQVAMAALPAWPGAIDRPFVPQAGRQLNDAHYALRESRVLEGHTADVNTARFSADEAKVLTASDDGTARLWDVGTGRELRVVARHPGKVLGARFAAGERLVATIASDAKVYVWNAQDGKPAHTLVGHTGPITSFDVAEDRDLLISASRDGTARVWKLEPPGEIRVLSGHHKAVNAAVLSRDGGRALTASDDGTAILWSLASGDAVHRLVGHSAPVLGAKFDPTGTLVATWSEDLSVRIWDASTGRERAVLRGHRSLLGSVAFCPGGSCLVSGAGDGIARLWDTKSGTQRFEMKGHAEPILPVVFDPTGTLVATAARDNLVRVWEVATGELVLTLGGHTEDIFDLAFAPKKGLIVTTSRDRTARIWRLYSPSSTSSRTRLATPPRSIDVSGGKQLLAIGDMAGGVHILNGDTLETIATAKIGQAAVTLVRFDRTATRLLAGTADGHVRLYASPTLALQGSAATGGAEVASGEFSADGKTAAVLTPAGGVHVFDGRTLTRQREDGKVAALVVAIAPAGDRGAYGGLNGEVRLVDLGTGRTTTVLRGHKGAILHLAFDGTGRLLVSASEDGVARVWDTTTGTEQQVLRGHTAPVNFVAFSSVSGLLATAAADRSVRIWKLGTASPLAVYAGHLAAVQMVRFEPGRNVLVSAAADGEVHSWRFDEDFRAVVASARGVMARCLSREEFADLGLGTSISITCSKAP